MVLEKEEDLYWHQSFAVLPSVLCLPAYRSGKNLVPKEYCIPNTLSPRRRSTGWGHRKLWVLVLSLLLTGGVSVLFTTILLARASYP